MGATLPGLVPNAFSPPVLAGGADTAYKTRTFLTDTTGAQVAVGSANPSSVPVTTIETLNTETGASMYQMLQQHTQLLTAIAFYLKEGFGSPHEPAEFRDDVGFYN